MILSALNKAGKVNSIPEDKLAGAFRNLEQNMEKVRSEFRIKEAASIKDASKTVISY